MTSDERLPVAAPPSPASQLGLLVALPIGGALVGLVIAITLGGSDELAMVMGTATLPAAFALGIAAWRAILAAWVLGVLSRSLLRSRGDEDRFQEEAIRSFTAVRDRGVATLPATWVFVPVALLVGLIGGALMALVGRVAAGAALFAASVAYGVLLRRLARRGRLLPPDG